MADPAFRALLRDRGGRDLDDSELDAIGILPAFTEHSREQSRLLVVDQTGAGSAYFALPAGWVSGWSRLVAVETPLGQQPPAVLDISSWRMIRSTADPTVEQILLDRQVSTNAKVRWTFTAPWPLPNDTAATDLLDDYAFEAVVALVASHVCVALAGEAARARAGSVTIDVADGADRARALQEAARMYRAAYRRYLGVDDDGGGSGSGGSGPAAAYGRIDLDPSWDSLFHGGRR